MILRQVMILAGGGAGAMSVQWIPLEKAILDH
jgi:hypothetical protein